MSGATHRPTRSHNYLRKIQDLFAVGGFTQNATLDIRHDAWCDALAGCGFCNCDPEILLRDGLHPGPEPR